MHSLQHSTVVAVVLLFANLFSLGDLAHLNVYKSSEQVYFRLKCGCFFGIVAFNDKIWK